MPVEENVIILFEESEFAQWTHDQIFAHFEQLWSIRIAEAPDVFSGVEFYVPEAQAILQGIVADCQLGETILQPQHHGMRTLHIDDLNLSDRKVACVRQYEQEGISLEPPLHILNLEQLQEKGILGSVSV